MSETLTALVYLERTLIFLLFVLDIKWAITLSCTSGNTKWSILSQGRKFMMKLF